MSSSSQVKNPPLDKRAVRIALANKGWSQAALAKRIGVNLTSVNLAINHNSYPRVSGKIRKALGLL